MGSQSIYNVNLDVYPYAYIYIYIYIIQTYMSGACVNALLARSVLLCPSVQMGSNRLLMSAGMTSSMFLPSMAQRRMTRSTDTKISRDCCACGLASEARYRNIPPERRYSSRFASIAATSHLIRDARNVLVLGTDSVPVAMRSVTSAT